MRYRYSITLGLGAAALGLSLLVAVNELWAHLSCDKPAALRFDVVNKIVRSEPGFTQGLVFHNGQLYESTGRVGGNTRLNTISLTGEVSTLADVGAAVFGEGLTIINDELIQLTWREHKVFAYDVAGNLKRTMHNPNEGWGLANDGTALIYSDGGPSFYYADRNTFAIQRTVRIKTRWKRKVTGLNELELVRGKLYGNIFATWNIVRLDPATGCVEAVADMRSLLDLMTADEKQHVAVGEGSNVINGIAFDEITDLFFVTGKRWKTIYTGRFHERRR